MIRGLLIFATIGYVLYKAGKFFFGIVHNINQASKGGTFHQGNAANRNNGNISVDKNTVQKNKEGYKGGEYVDYEEL